MGPEQSLTELKALNNKLDTEMINEEKERMEREIQYAKERELFAENEKKLKFEAERLRKEEEERLKKEEEDRLKKQEEERKKEEELLRLENERLAREEEEKKILEELMSPILSKERFKDIWGNLPVAGSFQCKLKSPPINDSFVSHLGKQGFHIVFVTASSSTESEVGICNIRIDGSGPWFVSRFVYGKSTFSAVMKCEDQSLMTNYVKKFALAKVLKIDTSS